VLVFAVEDDFDAVAAALVVAGAREAVAFEAALDDALVVGVVALVVA
jgi:hypothetical protein